MTFLPDFRSASFKAGAPINNQYFPLSPGTVMASTGVETATGEDVQADDVFVTSLTRELAGVQTTVVRDTVYEDGLLAEDTLDYYAQDTKGNVWYLGETVIDYEYDDKGKFVGTNSDGAWLAGVDGALPGWIMPAKPTLGFSFFNEFAPGVALDESQIVGTKLHLRTDFGQFAALKTADTSQLEPGIVEYKYYAPGVGIVREEEDFSAQGVPGLVSDLTQMFHTGASRLPNNTEPAQTADFVSDGTTKYVTITLEDSEFDDSLGYYTFNPVTGVIGEARIIFNGATGQAGDTIAIDVSSGLGIGFFLIADSSELGLDLSKFDKGGLYFENMLTGGPANLADGMAPIVTDKQGDFLPISAFQLLGAAQGADLLNPGTGAQGVEWDLGKNDAETVQLLGFEDHRITDGDYDGDFNDLMFAFGDAPVNPADFSTIGGASAQLVDAAQLNPPADWPGPHHADLFGA
jgi:hypothetical protein